MEHRGFSDAGVWGFRWWPDDPPSEPRTQRPDCWNAAQEKEEEEGSNEHHHSDVSFEMVPFKSRSEFKSEFPVLHGNGSQE